MQENSFPSCPLPISQYKHILLAHGGGGKLSHDLIEKIFLPVFFNDLLDKKHDSTVLDIPNNKIAFTTDSYVINPLFFPGGDIGTLAVNGTINDLAMSGAKPLYLSVSFILEEGLEIEKLWKIALSIQKTAHESNVKIVTGDTKVVHKGKGDGIFINTTGIGLIQHNLNITPCSITPGDYILINGDIAQHGISIMALREGLSFETTIESDSIPLANIVLSMLSFNVNIHCLRDITRGGLASVLNELADTAHVSIHIDERSIPIRQDVLAACEILGLDPLSVASEGRFLAFVPEKDVELALSAMNLTPNALPSSVIGKVLNNPNSTSPKVLIKNLFGIQRILDMHSGELLPRIC